MAPRKNKSARKKKRQQAIINNGGSQFPNLTTLVSELNSISNNMESTPNLHPDLDKFIVEKTFIKREIGLLGEGSFGFVTLGTLNKPDSTETKVALKGARVCFYTKMMIDEARVMANLDHPNVVKLLAVEKAPFKIVMEYMALGDLVDALRHNIVSSQADLMNILFQITSGMEYISQKNYVHRDLAYRNVFVNDKKQCKIGDFGLCKYVGNTHGVYKLKDHEYYNNFGAPETMDFKKFTTKSDVWSMGLLIWELYFEVSDIHVFYKRVILDLFTMTRHLQTPKTCPMVMNFYMKNLLLNEDANMRPDFSQIKEDLNLIKKKI